MNYRSMNVITDRCLAGVRSLAADIETMRQKAKAERIKLSAFRPYLLERAAVVYKVALVEMKSGKLKFDSEATHYEAAKRAVSRLQFAVFGDQMKKSSANTDPVTRIERAAGKMTKPQIKRAIKALEALL